MRRQGPLEIVRWHEIAARLWSGPCHRDDDRARMMRDYVRARATEIQRWRHA